MLEGVVFRNKVLSLAEKIKIILRLGGNQHLAIFNLLLVSSEGD